MRKIKTIILTTLMLACVNGVAQTAEPPAENYKVEHMSSDRFYGLIGPENNSRGLAGFTRTDYHLEDGLYVIENGPNTMNRPLTSPGNHMHITAGDHPAFVLWTGQQYHRTEDKSGWGMIDLLSYCFIGVGKESNSKWLHEYSYTKAILHPGWYEYVLSDKPGDTIRLELVPSPSGAFYIHLRGKGHPGKTRVYYSFGAANYAPVEGKRMQNYARSYVPTHNALVLDDPEACHGDSIHFGPGYTVVQDDYDLRNWAGIATAQKVEERFIIDCHKRLDSKPHELKAEQSEAPAALGILIPDQTENGWQCVFALQWGRDNFPAAEMKLLTDNPMRGIEEGKAYYRQRTERTSIETPDPRLDAYFKYMQVGADYLWNPPAINHGPFSWGGLTQIFRIHYGPICIGDHTRVASAFRYFAGSDEYGRPLGLSPSPEDSPEPAWYENYGSIADMLWQYYRWTGDKAMLALYAPILEEMLRFMNERRKDKRGLYIDHLGFWASDSFNYEEGCLVSSIFAWRVYYVRGLIARELGEDPEQWLTKAEELKSLIYEHFWSDEDGYFFDSYVDDSTMVTKPIAPGIYHPIEYGFTEKEQSLSMMDYLVRHYVSEHGIVRLNDWHPINWSHHIYSPLESSNTAIAAYDLRMPYLGKTLIEGVTRQGTQEAFAPGTMGCLSNSKGMVTNDMMFADGVSLFLKSVVEGLFGIKKNIPEGKIEYRPNIPPDWDRASITLPGVPEFIYNKKEKDGTITASYTIETSPGLALEASLYGGAGIIAVKVNGENVDFDIEEWFNVKYAKFFSDKKKLHQIEIVYTKSIEKDFDIEITKSITNNKPTQPEPVSGEVVAISSDSRPEYETLDLSDEYAYHFSKAHLLYPGELVWGLHGEPEEFATRWNHYIPEHPEIEEEIPGHGTVPFRIDTGNVLAVKKVHLDLIWQGFPVDSTLPAEIVIPVGEKANAAYMLLSGFCSIMTSYLPQLRISLIYEDGNKVEYELASPVSFDFISQHVTAYPPVSVGWFGKTEVIDKLKADDIPAINGYFHQLHADAIALRGRDGELKEIRIKALQRHSGAIIHAVSTGWWE